MTNDMTSQVKPKQFFPLFQCFLFSFWKVWKNFVFIDAADLQVTESVRYIKDIIYYSLNYGHTLKEDLTSSATEAITE